MARALGEYEVDAVFHLAAQTILADGRRSPLPTFETNVRGTWTLLEACRTPGRRAIVVAASDTVYGPERRRRTPRSYPLQRRLPLRR